MERIIGKLDKISQAQKDKFHVFTQVEAKNVGFLEVEAISDNQRLGRIGKRGDR